MYDSADLIPLSALQHYLYCPRQCAQALCLEEMIGITIPEGCLFYGKIRRRNVVVLDNSLREITRRTAEAVHELLQRGVTPPPPEVTKKLCPSCSLYENCLPVPCKRSASRFVASLLEKL